MKSVTKGAASPRLLSPLNALPRPLISLLLLFSLLLAAQLGGRSFNSNIYAAFFNRIQSLGGRSFSSDISAASLRLQPLRKLFSSHHAATQESPATDLTVHEWGTFTSIAGPDGQAMEWLSLTGSTDLPSFVEHLGNTDFKGGLRGTIRMETPVLYFYSSRENTVSVHATLSKGLITEWYPHASVPALDLRYDWGLEQKHTEGAITWDSVHIDPHGSSVFPGDTSTNHYYAARNTSAAPLFVDTPSGPQREKFLFYRGVSALLPPLTATLSPDGTVNLQNHLRALSSLRGSELQLRHMPLATAGLQPLRNPLFSLSSASAPASLGEATSTEIPNVILFERRGNKLGYSILGPLQEQASLAQPALDGSLDALSSDLEGLLISQGLNADESHAMLETWKNSWFEEGSRLIYIVPRSFVDSVLPLSITPPPASTVRVFVGRLELVTPATQQAVESAFASGDRSTLAHYSRFLEPILQSMIQQTTDPARQQRLSIYLNSVYTDLYSKSSN